MDDKLSAVLGNPELMAKIAALIKGETSEPPPEPQPSAVRESAPAFSASAVTDSPFNSLPASADRGVALLYALRPFLKESRRRKLDAATGAISVASMLRGNKKL